MVEFNKKLQEKIGHNLVFFGDGGISMSDANSVAGKAGDIADSVNRLLSQTGSFIKTTDLDGKRVTLEMPKKLGNITEIAKKDGELYGLKAYLMEAIKAKNQMIDYLKIAPIEEFKEADEEFERFDTKEDELPEREETTENTVLQNWTLEERAEYYLLEARVAHLGKKIHPNGIFDNLAQNSFEGVRYEREELNSGEGGTKTHIAEVTSVYTPAEAQTAFYELHDERRELEKRLNFFKARLKNELNQQMLEAEKDYRAKLNEFNEMQTKKRERNEKLRSIWESRRLDYVRKVSDLKILIPNVLKEIYDFVVNFSGALVGNFERLE